MTTKKGMESSLITRDNNELSQLIDNNHRERMDNLHGEICTILVARENAWIVVHEMDFVLDSGKFEYVYYCKFVRLNRKNVYKVIIGKEALMAAFHKLQGN